MYIYYVLYSIADTGTCIYICIEKMYIIFCTVCSMYHILHTRIYNLRLCYIIYYIRCTMIYYILYTIYYNLYTIYYILYVIYYILYTIYYILYTITYIPYTVYYMLYIVYVCCKQYTIYYIIYM